MVKKSLSLFFFLIVIFSLPFWLIGYFFKDLFNFLPINLPVSSLMFLAVFGVTLALVYKAEKGAGIKKLLARIWDFKLIKPKIWYLPTIFLMPLVMFITYLIMFFGGFPLPKFYLPLMIVSVFLIAFFIEAIFEELGFTAYVLSPLQQKYGALTAGFIIGIFWALWHIIPYIQANHDYLWIVGQCLTTIFARVLMVWIYNNAGQSLVLAILFHTMLNVSEFSFPNLGSHYNPLIAAGVMAVIVGLVIFFWGARTLSKFRFRI